MERQSRQQEQLISLAEAGGAHVEKELYELLRLQRKLRTSPERNALHKVLSLCFFLRVFDFSCEQLQDKIAPPPPPPPDTDDEYDPELAQVFPPFFRMNGKYLNFKKKG
jgi:hypothetical protein